MYGLAHRALHLLQERDAQLEDDVGDRHSRQQARKTARPRKPTTWTWVMAQLLDLLRQYPGGLAEPALLTELLSRRIRKQGKPDCAGAIAWDGTAGCGGAGGGGVDGNLPQLPGAAPSFAGTLAPGCHPGSGGSGSSTCSNMANGCGNGGGGGSGANCGFLPGQVAISALAKAPRPSTSSQQTAASNPSPSGAVAVAAVACVECLSPPHGSGPPFETVGGSWLLHLEEEGGPPGATWSGAATATTGSGGGWGSSLGSLGDNGSGTARAASAAVSMYLHSELRLLVMGRTPLVAAGRRVRIAGVPARSVPAAASPLAHRLLPTRLLVPELPVSQLAGGCWPHFDALRHGGTEPMLLGAANSGALGAVAPGGRAGVTGWVLARVAAVGAAPPRAPAAFDRYRKRFIQLVDPSTPTPPSGTAAASTTLVLYSDAVAFGDLLAPGEVVAMYQPIVFAHEPPSAAAAAALPPFPPQAQREPLLYEHGPDTILAVLPPGWTPPAAPGAAPPPPSAAGHQGAAAMDLQGDPWPQAAAGGPAAAGAKQLQYGSQQPQWAATASSQSAGQEPRHALLGLGSMGRCQGPSVSLGQGQMQANAGGRGSGATGAGNGASAAQTVAAAAACTAPFAGSEGGGSSRTVVVARVQALLGYSHGAGTSHGGRLRALMSDGTGAVAVELQLAKGSRVLSHMREGHVVVLLGAVQLPPAGTAAAALAAAATAALQNYGGKWQGQPPATVTTNASFGDNAAAPGPMVQALTWSETATGSEARSLTSMPAQVTTPPLVSYTCLAALWRAHRAHLGSAPCGCGGGDDPHPRFRSSPPPPQQPPAAHQYHRRPPQHHTNQPPLNQYGHPNQQHQQRQQQQHQYQHPQQATAAAAFWPADMLHPLAEATRQQLPDPRHIWGRDVPYLQRPFRLAPADGPLSPAHPGSSGGSGGGGSGRSMSPSATVKGPQGGRRSLPGDAARGPYMASAQGWSPAGAGTATAAGSPGSPAGAAARSSAAAAECAPDVWCRAVACVVALRAARVATHRVHRQCGRPVRRAASMFMDLDFDDAVEDEGGGGGGGSGPGGGEGEPGGAGVSVAPAAGPAAGGGGAVSPAPADGAPGSHPVAQDTPSKDQSMDGLWECAFCGLDLVRDDLTWQYHGSLALEDVAATMTTPDTHASARSMAGAGTVGAATSSDAVMTVGAATSSDAVMTLPADPEALHGLLGVSAAAFHALSTARRRKLVEACLLDRRGAVRRCVVALYPKPWRHNTAAHGPHREGPVAALSFNGGPGSGGGGDGGGGGAGSDFKGKGSGCCPPLADCWAVAQLHLLD